MPRCHETKDEKESERDRAREMRSVHQPRQQQHYFDMKFNPRMNEASKKKNIGSFASDDKRSSSVATALQTENCLHAL